MASKVESKKPEAKRITFLRDSTIIFTFTLLLFFTILFIGCNNTQTTGVDPAKQISPDERKAQLLKSLDRKFENPDAHFELGKLFHAERQWSQAEWRYNRALNFDPVHWQAQAAMVKLFIDSRESAKAKNYADIYMNKVSVSAPQSLELALAFQNEALDEYATACFQQALNLAPNSSEIHKKIGYFYLSKNDKVRAEDHFVRSYELNNKQPDVAYELGRLGVQVQMPQKTGPNNNNPD